MFEHNRNGRSQIGLLVCIAATMVAFDGTASAMAFTEDFDTNTAGWLDATSGPLDFNASGGPDGSSYVSTTQGLVLDPGTVMFRGGPGASGGAFTGDWTGGNVTVLSAFVRHDAPAPVSFFFRITTGTNFPAFAGIVPVPVFSNTWTEISLVIDPSNPLLIPEGPFTFDDVFASVTNVQIGAIAPDGFELVPFGFDLDQVTIVPEPGTAALLALGLAGLGWRSRRSG